MSLFQGPQNKNAAPAPRQNNEDTSAVQTTVGSTPHTERMARIKVMADDYNARRNAKFAKPATDSASPISAEPSAPAAAEQTPSTAPTLDAAPQASVAPAVDSPAALPEPGPMGGLQPNAPSKKEFLEAVGANRYTAEPERETPSKKDFLEAVGATNSKPSQPDTGPTKKDFLRSVGANKEKPSKPDKGPTKKDFLESVGANKAKASEPDKGPTKKEFLEAVGANKSKPSKPDKGPTKKDFLAAVKGESKSAAVEEETTAVGGETAVVETATLGSTSGGGAVTAPTDAAAGSVPATPEAVPEAPVVEEKPAEELPKEAPVTEAGAAAPGAPGEGEGDGKKEKPKEERPKSKGFLAAVANVKKTAEEQTEHAPPQSLSVEAQAAAEVPENESMGDAQAAQVDEMAEQEPVEFSAANFKAMLMDRIKQMELPDNAEKADDFENNNNIDEVNEASKEDVQKEKDAAAGPIKSTNEKAPDPSAQAQRVADPLAPLDPGKKVKSAKANKAVPDPRPDSEVSQPIQDETAKLDDNMAANNVTDKQLEISQEPKFVKGLEGKNEAKAEAQKSTEQMRQQEAGTLQETGQKAEGTSQEQLAGMNLMRGSSLQQVAGGQQTAGKKDTTEREKVAIKIDEIFTATQTDVTAILDTLDTDVNTKFEAATTRAKQAFEDHVDRKMNKYKYDRYLKYPGGLALWLIDAIAGMPDEVNEFFVEGRQVFIDEMDKEITIISEIVATKLNEAKQRVETGKQEVTDYVNSLPANLKAVGKEAADDIQDKFDALTEDVNAKQDELVDSMADQYQAALEEVDERIEEMKAANRGLVGMVMDMINGIIETIRKLTEAINNLLSAISSVIGIIMADPIGFMGLLFDGISKGFDMFAANIQKHLLGGLASLLPSAVLEWLTGSLGPMGITVPDDIFSLGGIFNLVMQVLGLG